MIRINAIKTMHRNAVKTLKQCNNIINYYANCINGLCASYLLLEFQLSYLQAGKSINLMQVVQKNSQVVIIFYREIFYSLYFAEKDIIRVLMGGSLTEVISGGSKGACSDCD